MFRRDFLRNQSSIQLLLHIVLDLVLFLSAAMICYLEILPHRPFPERHTLLSLLAGILLILVFAGLGLYDSSRRFSRYGESRRIVVGMAIVALLLVLALFLLKASDSYSRFWIVFWFTSATTLIAAGHIAVRDVLASLRSRGRYLRKVVVFSEGELANDLIQDVKRTPELGYRIVRCFGESGSSEVDLDEVITYLRNSDCDEVWIVLPLSAEKKISHIVNSLPFITADIRLIPDLLGLQLINSSISQIGSYPSIDLSVTPMGGLNLVVKTLEDKVLSSAILLLISPLMLIIAAAVALDSRGPIFYKQERVSWNGKHFNMYKFRTMPVDAESGTGPVWARPGESRATRTGGFLRRTSLDELPQFWNVLVGDMSIVGPRPERPHFVEQFREEIPQYMQKHMVKAGITGWAQVNGWRGSTDLKKRIEHDIYYIEHWSLLFDFKIIFLTILNGFVNKNAY